MTLWRIRTTVDDRPGFLAVLAASFALRSINILAVQVHSTPGGAVDEFLVDAPDSLVAEDLVDTVIKGRGRDPWVMRTDAHGLVDTPVQALGQAARLIREPELLPEALAALLGDAATVSWHPSRSEPIAEPHLVLPDPAGGTLVLRRPAPQFTPAEAARARALVEVAAAAIRANAARWLIMLADGTEVAVRAAVVDAYDCDDIAAVQRLHDRCSPHGRYRRYLSGTSTPPARQLLRLLSPRRGATLLAEVSEPDRTEVIAMATVIVEGNEAEVALLVADGWQRRGLGTALLRRLVAIAPEFGAEVAHLHTHADNEPLVRTVARVGRSLRSYEDGALVTVTIAVGEPVRPALQVDSSTGT